MSATYELFWLMQGEGRFLASVHGGTKQADDDCICYSIKGSHCKIDWFCAI
jgi:hypothetical protein